MLKWMVLAIAVFQVRPAEACDCAQDTFGAPAVGATNLATTTNRLYVAEDVLSGQPLSLVDTTSDVTITLTALDDDFSSQGRRFTIDGTLTANTSYALRGSAEDVAYFTTGADADTTAPPAPTVTGFAMQKQPASSCGDNLYAISGTVTAPEADILVAELTSGNQTQRFYVNPDGGLQRIGGACGLSIAFDATGDVQLKIWSEDLSGNRSGEMMMTTEGEGEGEDDGGGCSTGGASAGGLIGLLALRRRRRLA